MTESRASLYHCHHSPAAIIAEAVWLYFHFPLSFRMVEDMPAYGETVVTHKTVHSIRAEIVVRTAQQLPEDRLEPVVGQIGVLVRRKT